MGFNWKLFLLPETMAICQVPKDVDVPQWALAASFYSITRTAEELSVVCPQTDVPEGIKKDEGWRCLKVEGPLDFSATGILASLTMPLAKEEISVFAVSTYNTDYLLVKAQHLEKAVQILSQNGHRIQYLKKLLATESTEITEK
ncbi:MAG: ACT domain-containing protein [Proteobacteria bacterium]|nr:ACT domain-containing protein [Pseudomonadota bacterium]